MARFPTREGKMESSVSALGAIMVMLAILALAILVGLKPETNRGVVKWSFIAAFLLMLVGAVFDWLLGQGIPLVAIAVAFFLITGLLLLFSLAIRAVVDRIARVRSRG
jgi:ABC-type transport system involved in cytochrome c biogenesis permease subunit